MGPGPGRAVLQSLPISRSGARHRDVQQRTGPSEIVLSISFTREPQVPSSRLSFLVRGQRKDHPPVTFASEASPTAGGEPSPETSRLDRDMCRRTQVPRLVGGPFTPVRPGPLPRSNLRLLLEKERGWVPLGSPLHSTIKESVGRVPHASGASCPLHPSCPGPKDPGRSLLARTLTLRPERFRKHSLLHRITCELRGVAPSTTCSYPRTPRLPCGARSTDLRIRLPNSGIVARTVVPTGPSSRSGAVQDLVAIRTPAAAQSRPP